jgi:DNA-binding MarR family transcriptional regulator
VSGSDASALSEELVAIMAGLRRVLRRRLRPTLPGTALRGAQLELLQLVESQPGIGVAAAGRALHLAPNSVSTLATELVEQGLLVRRSAPQDRRATRLCLTPQASQRLAAWRQARGELVTTGLAALTETERRALAAALPALRALLAALEAEEER